MLLQPQWTHPQSGRLPSDAHPGSPRAPRAGRSECRAGGTGRRALPLPIYPDNTVISATSGSCGWRCSWRHWSEIPELHSTAGRRTRGCWALPAAHPTPTLSLNLQKKEAESPARGGGRAPNCEQLLKLARNAKACECHSENTSTGPIASAPSPHSVQGVLTMLVVRLTLHTMLPLQRDA